MYDTRRGGSSVQGGGGAGTHGAVPGKRTQVEQLGQPPAPGPRALDPGTRSTMEQRLGHGFSDVRVHEGSDVAGRAGAQAVTEGTDIHFAPGQYRPEARDGQFLLGHELAHVVQQSGGSSTLQARADGAPRGGDPLEHEADAAGRAVSAGESFQVAGRVGRRPQCFNEDEHMYLGNEASRRPSGDLQMVPLAPDYIIPYGDVLALAGDHFGDLDQLRLIAARNGKGAATREEIEYVRQVEIHDRQDLKDTFSKGARESAERRYYKLAAYNANHFPNSHEGDTTKPTEKKLDQTATYGPQSEDTVYDGSLETTILSRLPTVNESAIAAYRRYHVKAILEAVQAAKAGKPVDTALVAEAFGGHFLSDSFSAGHIRTPRVSIEQHWDTKVPMFFYNLKGFMSEEIARKIAPTKTFLGRQVREDIVLTFGGAREKVFTLLDNIGPLGLGDVVGGALHDFDGEQGVKVLIQGQPVTLYGDGSFWANGKDRPESLDMRAAAIKALHAGIAEVYDAYSQGKTGKAPVEVAMSFINDQKLFWPETYIPTVVPEGTGGQTKQAVWKWDSYVDLLAASNREFIAALGIFCRKKASTIQGAVSSQSQDIQDAVKEGVVKPLLQDPAGAIRRVIEWSPTITDSALGHNTDDDSNDYWQEARRTPGGLASLNYPQRYRLIDHLLDGWTIGDDEDAIMDVLKSAPPSDQRRLIKQFGWDYLEDKIDDGPGSDFADAFPEDQWK